MTPTLAKAFREVAKLPNKEQEIIADFILDELAFRAAVNEGIEAADRGDVVPLKEVKQMLPQWASK